MVLSGPGLFAPSPIAMASTGYSEPSNQTPSGAGDLGTHDNVGGGDGLLENILAPLTPNAPTKYEILRDVPLLVAEPNPGITPRPNVSGGHYWIGGVQPGELVGVGGAETCVGVILVPTTPDPGRSIVIFHFQGTDKVKETLSKLNLTGYSAYISGGGQTGKSDADSVAQDSKVRYMLKDVVDKLGSMTVPIRGYFELGDIAIDSGGVIHNTTPAGTPTNQYKVNPPLPPPPLPGYIIGGPFIIIFDPKKGA